MTEKKKPNLPSFFTMAKNFSKDLAKYIKEGAPNVTSRSYLKRLETCSSCPHLLEEKMRCGKCGCLVEHKAKWRTTTCPDNRWNPEIILTDYEKERKPNSETGYRPPNASKQHKRNN